MVFLGFSLSHLTVLDLADARFSKDTGHGGNDIGDVKDSAQSVDTTKLGVSSLSSSHSSQPFQLGLLSGQLDKLSFMFCLFCLLNTTLALLEYAARPLVLLGQVVTSLRRQHHLVAFLGRQDLEFVHFSF